MKLGLIAISGIRAWDKELMDFGLTLPGFVERSEVVASLPSLGLLTLAGMTPPHHQIEYSEIRDLDEPVSASDRFDLVAISSFTAQIKEAYALADSYRSLGVPTVMGGLHLSCMPDEALQHCDAVVLGQGELSWAEVLQDAERGNLRRVYGRTQALFDLGEAPMPAFELLDISKYNRLTVQSSRGCPFQCEFCASSILISPKFRQKPIDKVLAEIDKIRGIWERPFIEFADDNSFVDRGYWKALLPELAKRKIRWFAETDLSVASDKSLLKLMRASGCGQVLIGFESAERACLDGLELKTNWKMKIYDRYRDAIKTIQSEGITVDGCFIFGLDNQDPNIFDSVLDFVQETELYEVQITILTPFPGTPLYSRLKDEGRLLEENAWEKCTLFDINFVPRNMTVTELYEGFRNLGEKLYSDEFTNWRREQFKNQLRRRMRKEKSET
ncbi:MAG: radical SAM protein [Candidatus Hydrogenedentes bacterium]|nr:radical SAM protein [Candidatus Hydrogenedentota bacterium]